MYQPVVLSRYVTGRFGGGWGTVVTGCVRCYVENCDESGCVMARRWCDKVGYGNMCQQNTKARSIWENFVVSVDLCVNQCLKFEGPTLSSVRTITDHSSPTLVARNIQNIARDVVQGSVVQKPIKANPRLKIKQGVYFSAWKDLFSADIRQNFTLEEVNLEKQK